MESLIATGARFTSRVESSSSRVDLTGKMLKKPNKHRGVHGFTGKNGYEGQTLVALPINHQLTRYDLSL